MMSAPPIVERLRRRAEYKGPRDLLNGAALLIETLVGALEQAAEELATIAVGMTGEHGWSAEDIARHESICATGDRISAALAKVSAEQVSA